MIQSLSFLIHAYSKTGKTTLAATAPAPILAMDAEGGWKFINMRMIGWDPNATPPPEYDGTWDVCVVNIRDWRTVTRTYDWLMQAEHQFQSLVVDSITEIQRRCKTNLKGTAALQIQDWGTLLSEMDAMIRGLRDLTLHPTHPLRVVVFIAESRQLNGKWRPSMQGQIVDALPYWCDIVGYLFIEQGMDVNGQATVPRRRLLISQSQLFEAGERVQGRLGGVVDDPNITSMYMQIFNMNGAEPL